MLTRFSISPGAVSSPDVEPAGRKLYHLALARLLYMYGVPVFASEAHRAAVIRAIASLPRDQNVPWTYLMERIRQAAISDKLPEIEELVQSSGSELVHSMDDLDLLLLSPKEANAMGCGEGEPYDLRRNPYLVKARYARHTPSFGSAGEHDSVVWSYDGSGADPRDEVAKLFKSVFEVSRKVSIVDRYLIKEMSRPPGALAWVASLAMRHQADGELLVYTQCPGASEARALDWFEDLIGTAAESRKPEGLSVVKLSLLPKTVIEAREQRFHDRFILFEKRAAISLSRGFDIFARADAKGEHDVTYSAASPGDSHPRRRSYWIKHAICQRWHAQTNGQNTTTWRWMADGWERDSPSLLPGDSASI